MTEDYRINLRVGRAVPTGSYTLTNRGNKKAILAYAENYKTPAGVLSPQEWKEKAMAAVVAEDKTELLESIIQYCKIHCAWLRTKEDLLEHALDCLCSKTYEHWPDFEVENAL